MAPVFFVQSGGTVPTGEKVILEGPLNKRGGATGHRGGLENWKSRHCRLVGNTLYYSESERSSHARGFLNLQGLGVRQADAECGRLLSICLYWPEDAEANFYLQAPNTLARDKWVEEIKKATRVTVESIAMLGIAELKQRCVVCGLVGNTDYSHERASLEEMLLAHVRWPTRPATGAPAFASRAAASPVGAVCLREPSQAVNLARPPLAGAHATAALRQRAPAFRARCARREHGGWGDGVERDGRGWRPADQAARHGVAQ